MNNFDFDNNIGCFNKKSVFIKKANFNKSFKQIASIELIKEKKGFYEVGYLLVVEVLILIFFFNNLTTFMRIIGGVILFFSLFIFFKKREEKKYIKIILCIPEQIFIKIDNAEYLSAKEFVNSFTLFRHFNSELD